VDHMIPKRRPRTTAAGYGTLQCTSEAWFRPTIQRGSLHLLSCCETASSRVVGKQGERGDGRSLVFSSARSRRTRDLVRWEHGVRLRSRKS
jgi:hypothetical protein